MSMVGAFCFPICLFWFGWTANRTHWISPVIASGFFGLGTTWMFMVRSRATVQSEACSSLAFLNLPAKRVP
jgi:hypothetical protein